MDYFINNVQTRTMTVKALNGTLQQIRRAGYAVIEVPKNTHTVLHDGECMMIAVKEDNQYQVKYNHKFFTLDQSKMR